ncbi:HAD family hydrolase [Dethiothermospora halolimnae]|uniref:HAD family hydrolase n=1 Tax=Dethiothermospora halolimnae TaxID=3114390 RepID=UPI003CCC28E1
MIKINIPSYGELNISHLVFDYNGTIAVDGKISDNVKGKLKLLKKEIDIHILTADTYGNARENLKEIDVDLHIISKENGTQDKVNFIKGLGSNNVIAIGNGNNDVLMIKEARVGICIVGKEGCSSKLLLNSDIVVNSINDCLNMLINTNRLKATLRK